jgi:hypothetical protein
MSRLAEAPVKASIVGVLLNHVGVMNLSPLLLCEVKLQPTQVEAAPSWVLP